MVELYSNIKIDHNNIALITLCGKVIKQSQTMRSGRFESNLLTWPGRLNTHVWNTVGSFPNNRLPFIPACGQCYSLRLQGTIFLPVVAVLRNININKNLSLRENERYIQSPVRSATRLTAYHIYGMWLVCSKT